MITVEEMVKAWALQIDLTNEQVLSITSHINSIIRDERKRCAESDMLDMLVKVSKESGFYTLNCAQDVATILKKHNRYEI